MAKLTAAVVLDHENDGIDVNLNVENVFFVSMTEPYSSNQWNSLAMACETDSKIPYKLGWEATETSIFVHNGVVTFTLHSGRGGSLQYRIEAIHCVDAFKTVANALSEMGI